MSGPLLPADLQRDVGMSAEEIHSMSQLKHLPETQLESTIQLKSTESTETQSPEAPWPRSPTFHPYSEHVEKMSLLTETSPDIHSGGFSSSPTRNSLDLQTQLNTPRHFVDQSPDPHERSETSLSSAIAAISLMAAASAGGPSSPFSSLDALGPTEGEQRSAGDRRAASNQSQPALPSTEKGSHFSNASDSTAPSPDVDIRALLRILTPQTPDPTENRTSPLDESMHQSDQASSPCALTIPLFGRRASQLLNEINEAPLTQNASYASEAVLSSFISRKTDREMPATTTSCTDLGRRNDDNEINEGDDTIEPLDSFLLHTMGSTRKKNPTRQWNSQFQSPSSGTFLNKSYYQGDAQETLKRLLNCFVTLPDERGGRSTQENNETNFIGSSPYSTNDTIESSSPELGRATQSASRPHLPLSPPSKESLSPCGQSSVSFVAMNQGASTAPAAMMTDAEAILANLLNSFGTVEDINRSPSPDRASLAHQPSNEKKPYDWGGSYEAAEQDLNNQDLNPSPPMPPTEPTWAGSARPPNQAPPPPAENRKNFVSSYPMYRDQNYVDKWQRDCQMKSPNLPQRQEHPGYPGPYAMEWAARNRDYVYPFRPPMDMKSRYHPNEYREENQFYPPGRNGGYDSHFEDSRHRYGQMYDVAENDHQPEYRGHSDMSHPYPSEVMGSYEHFVDNNRVKRVYSDDRDRMVYVSWIPKKARAYNTADKRKMELDLKRKLREDLALLGLTKVLLFPPKGVHCKLIFDSRPSAANFMTAYGGENRSEETERWKVDLCRIYGIDMLDKFDKTVVKIEWSQK